MPRTTGSNRPAKAPNLTRGVYFRLLFPRTAAGDGENVEPTNQQFILDLILDPAAIEFDGLTPARFAPASGTQPAHLQRATKVKRPSDKPRKTRLYVRGAFRVSVDAEGTVDAGFVDLPDPFDAELSSGPIFEAWFEPPHFFLDGEKGGGIGASVGNIIVDFSKKVTAPQVVARGQSAEWQGIALEEATIYSPQLGDFRFNAGVRDLIVGSPFGLQGEVFVELGRDPADVSIPEAGPVRIFADADGAVGEALTITQDPNGSEGTLLWVALLSDGPNRIRAQLDSTPPNTVVEWTLPGNNRETQQEAGFSSVFTAEAGDLLNLELTRVDMVEGKAQTVRFNKRSFVFTPAPAMTPGPQINLEVPGSAASPFENVLSISGELKELHTLAILASDETQSPRWESLFNDTIQLGHRYELDLRLPTLTIEQTQNHIDSEAAIVIMALRDAQNRARRIFVDIVRSGSLIIGTEDGVFNRQGEVVPARNVKDERDLGAFHKNLGSLQNLNMERVASGGTTISPDGSVVVPPGIMAELTLSVEGEDTDDEDDAPAPAPVPGSITTERAQILMKFDRPKGSDSLSTASPGWGDTKIQRNTSAGLDDSFMPVQRGAIRTPDFDPDLEEALTGWIKARVKDDPTARVLIIGHTDDLNSSEYNQNLALRRARAVDRLIRASDPDIAWDQVIQTRGEQDNPTPLETSNPTLSASIRKSLYATDAAILEAVPDEQLDRAPGELATLISGNGGAQGRLITQFYALSGRSPDKMPRPFYRRVDIVVGYTAQPVADIPSTKENEAGSDPNLRRRRIWVPGSDATDTARIIPSTPKYPFLAQLCLGWDSPRATEGGDWIPTKAEIGMTWVHRGVTIPGADGGAPETVDVQSCAEDPTIPEFWKVFGRINHDSRTSETVVTIGLDSIGDPKGLACVANDTLAATMTFAPALLPLLDDADIDSGGARLAALIGLMGVGRLAASNGKFILEGAEAEARGRAITELEGGRLRVGIDYSVEADWDLGLIKGTNVKLRYRNVGLIFDLSPSTEASALDLDRLKFSFDAVSSGNDDGDAEERSKPDVQSPGEWALSNPTLGRLLRVAAARVGTGSAWFEVDMGLALDLGIVTVTQATVRATLNDGDFSVELRGLEVELDVPDVLRGRGKLSLDSTGGLSSAIDLEIIPVGISAAASLRIVDDFVSLYIETRFSQPLPLGAAGLGIFGFNGHLVVNGSRALPAGDVVERELAWYALDPANRYEPDQGSWALGLGAIVGTMPDEGFAFNAKGLLAIEVPDLSVVFGIDGQFLNKPGPATSKGAPPPDQGDETLRLLGLISVDSDALTVGIKGSYSHRRLMRIDVPIGGYFPFGGSDPYFLRIGSDGFVGTSDGAGARPGSPVIVSILPDDLDVQASAYFMIEEKGIIQLGNRPGFNFPGFAIGAGMAFELDWGNSAIGLEVSAELLAGIGFSPLTIGAGVFIKGEIHFLFLSAGIEGELIFRYVDRDGEESLTLRGRLCATVGTWKFKRTKCGDVSIGEDTVTVQPPSPVAGVDLVNRLDQIVGAAASDGAIGPTVWPDIIPVIHFAHSIDVQLPPNSAFNPDQIAGPRWVGSKDVQYAYRITAIEIAPVGRAPISGPLPAIWTFPSHRGEFPSADESPIGDERRDLHLLSRHPYRWVANLVTGGADIMADPVGSLERACHPTPLPTEACAYGLRAVNLGAGLARLTPFAPSSGPFSSYFTATVRETLNDMDVGRAAVVLADRGLQLVAGRIMHLPPGLSQPVLKKAKQAYIGSYAEQSTGFIVSLPMQVRLSPEVVEPELTLVLCETTRPRPDHDLVCDSYEDITQDFVFQSLDRDRFSYRSVFDNVTGFVFSEKAEGQRVFRYPDQGLEITLPERANEVSITVNYPLGDDDVHPIVRLSLAAVNPSGQVIETVTDRIRNFDENQTIRIRAPRLNGIARVRLSGGKGHARLVKICYRTKQNLPVDDLLGETRGSRPPTVVGTRDNGTRMAWTSNVIANTLPSQPCTLVQYTPPIAGVWTDVRIGPSRIYQVGIVHVCGITAEAQRQYDEAEAARNDFVNDWNTPKTAPRFVLDADTEYEVRVGWQADTWERPSEDGMPSKIEIVPPHEPQFGAVQFDKFTFRTAPATVPLAPDAPTSTRDETGFDPRQARRYIARLMPDHTSAPHFTDDPVQVTYTVDHVADLMKRYGRDLMVDVRRTDPPPASRPPLANPPPRLVPKQETPVDFPRELMHLSQIRVLDALQNSPCLKPQSLEGAASDLTFDLARNAEYDLLIVAPPTNDTDAHEAVLQRTHFRTSRYASARELLDALDFTEGQNSPSLPLEVLVDGALPSDTELGDAAFDAAMATLGLDPLPLSAVPRMALLLRDGPQIELAGVLLEGLEPIHRAGRLELEIAEIALGDASLVTLATRRRNDAGTRILLAPPAQTTFVDGVATMRVVLRGSREGLIEGGRFISAGGLRMIEERAP